MVPRCIALDLYFLQIRSATPADLISLNAFCPCSSCQASYKHKHTIVSFCASWTFSFSLKSSYTFHPLSVKDETSLKMTCEIRSLTGLQCDYMNLFILKIYASLNRTVNHPPRPKHVVSGLPRCLRPLLCHNESNMEIQLLLLLLIFEPSTIAHLFLRRICVMSSEKRGSLSSAAYRL